MTLSSSRGRTATFLVSSGLLAVVWLAAAGSDPEAGAGAGDNPAGRRAWTTSRVAGSPEPPPPFKAAVVFPRLKFDHPVLLTHAPGSSRLFVAEQGGRIFSFEPKPDATAELFFDLRKDLTTVARHPGAKETEAVYGLVFHPDFGRNRECFVCYTLKGKKGEKNLPDGSRVSRFRVTAADPPRIDPDSEEIVLAFPQGGHNGGDLHFGNDGCLYISTGDAADPNPPDPFKTGQDISDLLASILRIDVNRKDPGKAYAVPPDNPFVGRKDARPEVWAYGFRNPWRMSFDRKTGDLWAGDVGWEQWEMVYRVEKGGNYGWSIVEARQAVNTHLKPGPTPIRPPVIELPHSEGASVTGGYIYRGRKHPELVGRYVFGDWVTRKLWAATVDGDRLIALQEITTPTVRVIGFGEDRDGELYLLDYDAGTVHTLVKNDAATIDPKLFPRTLSTTGLFASTRDHLPAEGVYPFQINAHQWQDGAVAEHLVALPGLSSVLDHEKRKGLPGNVSWHHFRYHFPKDAVLVKTLSLDAERGNPATRRRVETQLLHFDGENWRGYTYAWRDDGSDADLVPADGGEKLLRVKDDRFAAGVREQVWAFHSRSQCLQCHNSWADNTLAFGVPQLHRDVTIDGRPVNQLAAFNRLGLIQRMDQHGKPQPPFDASQLAKEQRLADPHDPATPLADRARAYLHGNCAHCHRFGGGGSVDLELVAFNKLDALKIVDKPPTRGGFDLPDPRIVAPGDPGRSVLLYRMAKFGSGRMPHLGSELPDEYGVGLIRDWIRSLPEGHSPAGNGSSGSLPADWVDKLRTPAAALDLACLLGTPGCRPDDRRQVFAAVAKLPAGPVRDLFDGYMTLPGAERKLGSNPRPKAILSLKGDVSRGAELFRAAKLQCVNCHKVDGQGIELGPDLSAIGKTRTHDELLESLLDPSRRVEQRYQSHLVRTVSGQNHTGLIVRRTGTETVLKTAENKEVVIPADDLEAVQHAPKSMMPDGLLADLTPQQAADLLAFLAARK